MLAIGLATFGGPAVADAAVAHAAVIAHGVRSIQAISGIAPSSGPIGTVITITGSGLSATTAVTIGGVPAQAVNVVSSTRVDATVGAGTPNGANAVVVTTNNPTVGSTETSPTAFTVATPNITVSTASLVRFNTIQGTPSSPRSYTVSGTALGNNSLNVTAPPNYEVSLVQGGSYSTTGLSLMPGTDGNIATTTIYVRMTGATTGTYSGNVDNSSNGAVTRSVAVTGTVAASSFLDALPDQLTGFTATATQNSAAQVFNVTGNGLTNAVSVTAPAGYELSTTSGGTYTTTLSLPLTGSSINQDVYVRLQNTIGAGSYNGGIAVASGTNSRNVVVQGTVTNPPTIAAEPTSQGTVVPGITTSTSISFTLTPGNGTGRLLLLRQGSAVNAAPVDAFTYTANPVFGSGSAIGSSNFVVLNGTALSVTVTGLTANTQYYYALYEYNGTGINTNYLTDNPFQGSSSTLSATPTLAGELALEEGFNYAANTVLSTGTGGNWTELRSGSPNIQVTQGSLAFTEYGTPSSLGLAVQLSGNNAQAVQRQILSSTLADGNDLYYSAAINLSSTGTGNSSDVSDRYFMALVPNGALASATARVHVRNAGSNAYNIGLSFNSTNITFAQTSGTSTVFTTGQTYVVVVRYTRIAGTNNDRLRLYVLSNGSVPETEPATAAVDIIAPVEVNFTHVALRQDLNMVLTVDGIRAGSGWGATVGRPRFINNLYALRAGNYYDVSLAGSTSTVSVLGGGAFINGALLLSQGRLLTSTTNRLTLGSGATASLGTVNSFVDGPLAWTVLSSNTRTYPIGKGGIFRPFTLALTNQTGVGTYEVEMFNAPAPLGTRMLPSNITRISQVRYYTVQQVSGTGAANLNQVTLNYGSDDGVNDELNLRIVKSTNGGNYEDIGPTAGGTSSPSGSITSSLFNETFAAQVIFTLGNNIPGTNPLGNVLPVVLASFTGRVQGEKAMLNWTTASEKNSAYFEVQRSLDGLNFKTIGTKEAAGNSSTKKDYSFTDATMPGGTVYYRLHQVDFDGSSSTSDVVTLKKVGQFALSLYPNPATERLTVQAGADNLSWKVLNSLGQVLLHGDATGVATVEVASLPAGVYYLEAANGSQRQTQKFVKR